MTVVELLATAHEILRDPDRYTAASVACTACGVSCLPRDPEAVRWSIAGAIMRADEDQALDTAAAAFRELQRSSPGIWLNRLMERPTDHADALEAFDRVLRNLASDVVATVETYVADVDRRAARFPGIIVKGRLSSLSPPPDVRPFDNNPRGGSR